MSELQAVNVTDANALIDEVRKRFVAHYVRVGAILLVFVTVVWLVTVLSIWAIGGSNIFALSAMAAGLAYVLAWGYFIALFIVTHHRTGLLWSIVIPGTRFNLLLFPPILIVAVGFEMAFDLDGFMRSFITILAIYFSAYGVNWLFSKLLMPRDQVEAAAYGEHWLVLATVTLRDILFFRIPHERV